MNKLITLILLFTVVVFSGVAHAQQFPVVSQYMQNHVFLNPGATAADGKGGAQLLHRSQWAGYDTYDDASGAQPQLQLLTAVTRLKERTDSTVHQRRHGLGLVFMRNKAATLTTTDAKVSYAYHLPFTKKSTLALGVQAGMRFQSIDYAAFRVKHPDDPQLPGKGKETEGHSILTLGMWYEHEKYYIGIAADAITNSSYNTLGVTTNRNWTLTAGYHFPAGAQGWKITPSIMALSNSDQYVIAGGVTASHNNSFWGGITYRHNEAASLMLGFGMLKQKRLHFSYAMDYITSNSELKAKTSHEVMIGYQWE